MLRMLRMLGMLFSRDLAPCHVVRVSHSIHSILSVLRKFAPHRFPARSAVFQRMLFSRDLAPCHVVRDFPSIPSILSVLGKSAPHRSPHGQLSSGECCSPEFPHRSPARPAVFRGAFFSKKFFPAARSAVLVPFISQERRRFRSVLFAGSVDFPRFSMTGNLTN